MDHWLYKKLTKIFFYLSYHVSFKSIDRGFLEKFGPFGIVLFLRKLFANVFHFGSTNFYYVITVFLFISLSLLFLFLFGTVEDLFMLLFILLVTLFILGCLK